LISGKNVFRTGNPLLLEQHLTDHLIGVNFVRDSSSPAVRMIVFQAFILNESRAAQMAHRS